MSLRFCLWVALVMLNVALFGAGCRCDATPSEDQLPVSKPNPASSQAVASTGSCPSRPSWAGELADDVEVELLHASKQGERQHGTGYRLHADGTFETYDDVLVVPDETGRMVFKRVDGKWTTRGKVRPSALTALRASLAEAPAAVLKGKWRTKGARSSRTHLTTRRDGKHVALCYVGTEPPKPVQPLQDEIHDLVNHVEP